MQIPSSTYRIQLHKDFTFNEVQRIIDYLFTLGISTIYAAPIMQSTPGSMHGYDVTDFNTIHAELGSAEDLRSIARELRKKGMTWLQDIVPNHMAFHFLNYRLMDVLERGPHSPYYHYFDINWDHHLPELKGKVMVPFLGNSLETCMQQGEIKLSFNEGVFLIHYLDSPYPLSLSAYPLLLPVFETATIKNDLADWIRKLISGSEDIPYQAWQKSKSDFAKNVRQNYSPELIAEVVNKINNDKEQLHKLLHNQYYLLSYWKDTDSKINYRRFFTVNELICLRMEDDQVFQEFHTYLHKLFKEKIIQGFRIDHIDGLMDPGKYAENLRNLMGPSCYVIAEKILEAKEDMPAHWPLQGSSGYEFLSYLNQLLTNRKGARQLVSFYQELVPDMPQYRKLIFENKKLILENYMKGEWDNIAWLFSKYQLMGDFDIHRIQHALGLFMISLPVYRIYPESLPLKGQMLVIIHEAFEKAFSTGSEYKEELTHLRNLFTLAPAHEEEHERILHFLKRLMQFTGPITAKGVEDTTFYIYNPLISHDEVGDAPSALGMSIKQFHDKMVIRQASTPLSLNATATHDTKRGEDGRVRLNVLSRVPDRWKEHVIKWLKINEPFRKTVNGKIVPALNDEYFIYQSIVGGFPADLQVTSEWIIRIQSYLNKAMREAKVNTNWSAPDEDYEKTCEEFIANILQENHSFLQSFVPFFKEVNEHAMVYSLSQTLIKLTAPGIPDIYQGCELWDLSFVDPDNRRPVDYDKRMEFLWQLILKEKIGIESVFEYLRLHREEGIEKLYITWKTLNLRKAHALVFTEGTYTPLQITGKEINAAAYARNKDKSWVIVIIPLGLVKHGHHPAEDAAHDQFIVLPDNAPLKWTNLFTGELLESPNQLSVQEVFTRFPVALLISKD